MATIKDFLDQKISNFQAIYQLILVQSMLPIEQRRIILTENPLDQHIFQRIMSKYLDSTTEHLLYQYILKELQKEFPYTILECRHCLEMLLPEEDLAEYCFFCALRYSNIDLKDFYTNIMLSKVTRLEDLYFEPNIIAAWLPLIKELLKENI